jgi:hypothetical protein
MLTGVARRTADEFFAAVDRAIAEPAAAVVPTPVPTPVVPTPVPTPVVPTPVVPTPVLVGAPSSTESVGTVPVLTPGATGGAEQTGVWTAPEPPVDLAGQRMRDLLVGAAIGAIIALLGVVIGAIVAGW